MKTAARGARQYHRQSAPARKLLWSALLCLAGFIVPFYQADAADFNFTTDTSIDATNFTYDGQSILVDGAVLTVDGVHNFTELELINGAVLTHSLETPTKPDLTIGIVTIEAGSSIDVSAKGSVFSGTGRAGGSYGGRGGNYPGAVSNATYGNYQQPTDFGSGGQYRLA